MSDQMPLPASLRQDDGSDQVPLRALNEYVYCPRLHHLMYVQGIFVENADTIEGAAQHHRAEVRRRKNTRPKDTPGEVAEEASPWPAPPAALHLGSLILGLVGKLDALREADGNFVPVEYKRGPAPDSDRPIEFEGITLAAKAWAGDQVQIAGQVLLLRDNGYPCSHGLLRVRATTR